MGVRRTIFLSGLAGASAAFTILALNLAIPSLAVAPEVTVAPPTPVDDKAAAVADLRPPQQITAAARAPDLAKLTPPVERTVRVGRGDTLMALLLKNGVARGVAHDAIEALRGVYDPRRLKPGQTIVLATRPDGPDVVVNDAGDGSLVGLKLQTAIDRDVLVSRQPGGAFTASENERPLTRSLVHGAARIKSSLFLAGSEAGIPASVLVQLIRIFSFDVDFQRSVQAGDSFEIAYERIADQDNRVVDWGDVVYAALTLSGERHQVYRHSPRQGVVDYFDVKGASVRRALMRTPIDGARLSSRFGKRKHPILGYTKMHKGVDFAAPRGTPVYAAGNGSVSFAGRKGGFGKLIVLRHNNSYSTAYAHLSRYAKGIRSGKRVKQGQVIGYVGSTGRSTGPHLHYEVRLNGRQINPLTLKLPSGEKLKGAELAAFQSARQEMDRRIASLTGGGRLVQQAESGR